MDTRAVAQKVKAAKIPEDLFGILPKGPLAQQSLTHRYREFARLVHPDFAGPTMGDVMQRLIVLHDEAVELLSTGHYGKERKPIGATIVAKATYTNVVPICGGDLSDVYVGDYEKDGKVERATIKILRDSKDEDLATAEWKALTTLWDVTADGGTFHRYLPRPLETAKVTLAGKSRHANILSHAKNCFSLAEVIRAYPSGVDPRDMAWMWRRILELLAWMHSRTKVVHGAVIPDHFLIHPERHAGRLIDWSYAVQGSALKAIPANKDSFYPPEVFLKKPATPALDVYMSAQCALALVGGDPKVLPRPIADLLAACLLKSPHRRHVDALEVYTRFDYVLKELYGPPSFRPFSMPEAA